MDSFNLPDVAWSPRVFLLLQPLQVYDSVSVRLSSLLTQSKHAPATEAVGEKAHTGQNQRSFAPAAFDRVPLSPTLL